MNDFAKLFPEFPAIIGALQEAHKVAEEIGDQPLTLDTAARMLAAADGVLLAIDESDAATRVSEREAFAAIRGQYVDIKQSVERSRDDLIERATKNRPLGQA